MVPDNTPLDAAVDRDPEADLFQRRNERQRLRCWSDWQDDPDRELAEHLDADTDTEAYDLPWD